ncbi:MAG TPA: DUF4304 domain-containing protein [Acidimicrobiales bacterium]|nr:DUF4304 domain-containing protein [Acidimicrobiales bacterium]
MAPALRREGLRGSGSSYVLPDRGWWAQVGFQKSMSSTRDVVKFTVNLKVTDKKWWDEQRRAHSPMKDTPPPGIDPTVWDAERLERSAYPVRPSATTSGEGRLERLGALLPGVEGHQWWSPGAHDAEEVVDDALRALVSFGLPWLRQQLSGASSAADEVGDGAEPVASLTEAGDDRR